ncbi:MAG: orotidine-5'-phosphate decarboxylase [Clostridia bacterium]|nr:orotidine-5'-phosphate decarboxylase [Clostridia bacterium]
MSINQLIEGIIAKKSPIVVGLDPRMEQLPEEIIKTYEDQGCSPYDIVKNSLIEFNKGIIDSVKDLVPAVKPQVAFYEQYGLAGMEAYAETCRYAKASGLYVIADVKRGDIGSTSKAYSLGHLGKVLYKESKLNDFEADSVTVNPYLGDDCLGEFVDEIKAYDKGMFVLVKTSNKSSEQLQNLSVEGKKIYEIVGEMVNDWCQKTIGSKNYSPVGAVVGATYPSEMDTLRKVMPNAYFLVPGYGAQGGGGKDVVNAFNADGLGAIVNSSRGIIFAYKNSGLPYKEAARQATLEMQTDINTALEEAGKKYW